MTDYQFKLTPRNYQYECWDISKDRAFFAFFMMYGTGKSKVFIDSAGYLFEKGEIDGAVIVAPKGVYRNWLTDEIPKHLPDRIDRVIGLYDARGDKESRDSIQRLSTDGKVLKHLLLNIESINTAAGIELIKDFITGLKGRVIFGVDESTTIKTPSAQRTRAAIKLGRLAHYRRILTGDPYANSPIDIFAQFQFLDEDALGFPSFMNFRARFAKLAPVPGAPRWVRRIVGYKDLDELKRRVAPHAYFADKALLGLPPKVYLPARHAEMTVKQRKAYEDMRIYSLAEIGRQLDLNFEQTPDTEITLEQMQGASPVMEPPVPTASADIVLTQLLRLQQIACGFVKTEDGLEVDLCDGKNPRVAEVLQAIEEMGPRSKVIIWSCFTWSIHELRDALTAKYGVDSVVTYDGGTSAEDRDYAKVAFQDLNSPVLFFLSNQSTGGRGNTLTAATGVIYYAQQFDNELRANSEDRAHRLGLDHTVFYQDVETAPVDQKVSQALLAKKSVSEMLRDGSWKELFS